jgi:hypothetical protein
MIVRILGEGQFTITGEHLDELNLLDSQLQTAADDDDGAAFTAALRALRDAVRRAGSPLPADTLVASELVLPAQDTGLEQVRALLEGEGLIPG